MKPWSCELDLDTRWIYSHLLKDKHFFKIPLKGFPSELNPYCANITTYWKLFTVMYLCILIRSPGSNWSALVMLVSRQTVHKWYRQCGISEPNTCQCHVEESAWDFNNTHVFAWSKGRKDDLNLTTCSCWSVLQPLSSLTVDKHQVLYNVLKIFRY